MDAYVLGKGTGVQEFIAARVTSVKDLGVRVWKQNESSKEQQKFSYSLDLNFSSVIIVVFKI